ncbi:unnamed protein product [Lampetra planeri]
MDPLSDPLESGEGVRPGWVKDTSQTGEERRGDRCQGRDPARRINNNNNNETLLIGTTTPRVGVVVRAVAAHNGERVEARPCKCALRARWHSSDISGDSTPSEATPRARFDIFGFSPSAESRFESTLRQI